MKGFYLRDTVTGKEHNLDELVISRGSPISIGKHPDNSVILEREAATRKGINIHLVSNVHACLYPQNDVSGHYYTIEDNNSTNGTGINSGNGEVRALKTDEKRRLENGDKIFFHSYGPVIYEEREEN